MNLIEQLGGYERAKYEFEMIKEMKPIYPDEIETNDRLLLEYRRQHNIFEKGDWVVNIKTGAFGDFIKYADTNKGHKHCFVDIGLCDVTLFCVKNTRHATDAEIKAGKRLEVNDGN
ncbi:hypothetical protein [Acinetobacter towneri]|uniref:Uncharacterized protein n=1 Tax=Acinetobacter towneri TaxID=202956 RepID=A0AAP9GUA0_9GAMM|nr:hypothetical protein [Acinetobacter towneri]QGM27351.1 hypothetical protein GJD93_06525 [Acinetobacter towneri]